MNTGWTALDFIGQFSFKGKNDFLAIRP